MYKEGYSQVFPLSPDKYQLSVIYRERGTWISKHLDNCSMLYIRVTLCTPYGLQLQLTIREEEL